MNALSLLTYSRNKLLHIWINHILLLFFTGYSYAGLQYGTWCACGDSYGKHGWVGDSECNHACPGGPGHCGAAWRNSIYRTEAPAGRYLGCFKDAGHSRDLPLLTNNGNQNSISACIKSCSVTGTLWSIVLWSKLKIITWNWTQRGWIKICCIKSTLTVNMSQKSFIE